VTAAARKPALGLDPRVAAGMPEDVVKVKRSYTGQFLAPVLARKEARGGGRKRIEAAE
jgi:excinuclease ABC subunit A